MDVAALVVSGVAGFVVGLPAAAMGVAVPGIGPVRLRRSWMRRSGAWWGPVAAFAGCAAAAAGVVGARLGVSVVLPAFVVAAVVGVVLAVVDVRRRRLPFVFSVPVYAVGVACFAVDAVVTGSGAAAGRALAGAVLLPALLVVVVVVALVVPARKALLGLGDVVLVGWVAMTLAWLGWAHLWYGLGAGVLAQAVTVLVLAVRSRVSGGVPMGPGLVVGWLVGVVLIPS